MADFNGDGVQDLAGTDFSTKEVWVFAGKGDGTFAAPASFAAGNGGTIATADFNGDGHLDVVVDVDVNTGSSAAILLGDGTGALGAPQSVGIPSKYGYYGSVAVADVNGDGTPDVILCTGYYGSTFCSVALGGGDGTFAPAVQTGFNGGFLGDLAVADFNGDGKPDLVASTCDRYSKLGSIWVLLGDGTGSFTAAQVEQDPNLSWGCAAVAVADFDGNGRMDIAYTAAPQIKPRVFGAHVLVALGQGDGTFAAPIDNSMSTTESFQPGARVADFNKDGKPDLVVTLANGSTNAAYVMLGDGTGHLGSWTTYPLALSPEGPAVGDFDGNGSPDFVIPHYNVAGTPVLQSFLSCW